MNMTDVPAPRPVPAQRAMADRNMLMAHPLDDRRMAGGRKAAIGVATALTCAAVAAAGVLVTDQTSPTNKITVQCHTTTALGDGNDFAGSSLALATATTDVPVPIADAVGACADLWQQGVLQKGVAVTKGPNGRVNAVPPLVGCVTTAGIAAVFPSSDPRLCSGLGLRGLAR